MTWGMVVHVNTDLDPRLIHFLENVTKTLFEGFFSFDRYIN
jgi:hypothetical protein